MLESVRLRRERICTVSKHLPLTYLLTTRDIIVTLQWKCPAKTTLTKWSRSVSPAIICIEIRNPVIRCIVESNGSISVVLFPRNYDLSLVMRRYQIGPSDGHSIKYSSGLTVSWKTRKDWRTIVDCSSLGRNNN